MLITRMRWKAIHFNNNNSIDNSKEENTEWYGLKSPYSPRQVKELIPFENDLVELIRNIKFRKIRNIFQENLKEDIKLIKDTHKNVARGQDFKYVSINKRTVCPINKELHKIYLQKGKQQHQKTN